jgi:hypothetical protein
MHQISDFERSFKTGSWPEMDRTGERWSIKLSSDVIARDPDDSAGGCLRAPKIAM